MAKQLTVENFEQEIANAEKPVLIDFWATWCGPCMRQGPIIDQMGADGFPVYKVDVDAQPELAAKFHVMSIPTLVVMKQGKEVNRMMGLQTRETLERMLAEAES